MSASTIQHFRNRIRRKRYRAVLVRALAVILCTGYAWSSALGSGEEPATAASESSESVRTFTNKQGQKIEARVVALGGSMRTVSIERPDGRRFEIEIVSLSLDDQQFLKEWLQEQPAPDPENLSIQIQAEATLSEVSRERFEDRIYGGSGTRSRFSYAVSILNQSRHALNDVRLEYAILLHDLVSIKVVDPGEPDSVRWRVREKGPVIYRIGQTELPSLKYNTTEEVNTEALDHQTIRGASARGSTEDAQIGVLARLITKDGTVLAEFSDIDHHYPQITWEEFEARRGKETALAGQGELVESVAAN